MLSRCKTELFHTQENVLNNLHEFPHFHIHQSWSTQLGTVRDSPKYSQPNKKEVLFPLMDQVPRSWQCKAGRFLCSTRSCRDQDSSHSVTQLDLGQQYVICNTLLLFSCSAIFDSFATPWTVALQPPLSLGFPRQECWSGLPFPFPGDLLKSGIKPSFLQVSCTAGRFFTPELL